MHTQGSTLLLLLLPHLLLLTPAAQAYGPVKVGCLNYGHSCLGAHGKRGSWPPSVPRPPAPAAPQLPPFLQALAAPRSALRAWQDKVMTHHHQDQQQQHSQQQQQQQQQQPQVFPPLYDEASLAARVPSALHLALPKPDAAPLQDDDMLYYGTYEDDYGDARAIRSVDEAEEKKATPTLASISCLLFSRRC